jgi:hypothetical protein
VDERVDRDVRVRREMKVLLHLRVPDQLVERQRAVPDPDLRSADDELHLLEVALQRSLDLPPLGDVVEVDGDALGRRIRANLVPAIERGRVVLDELDRNAVVHRAFVRALKPSSDRARELGEEMLADEVVALQ